jgi:hypothetical protein
MRTQEAKESCNGKLQMRILERMRLMSLGINDVASQSGVNRSTLRRWINSECAMPIEHCDAVMILLVLS